MILLLISFFLSSVKAETGYSCETTFDQLNIPHVKTASVEEMYYCMGLYHGQDRAWEMDFFRRVGEGRNSEIYGFSQLKSDLMMRFLDLPAVAEKLWIGLPEEKKRIIEIYARGVNKGFETGKRSSEFIDKGYEPEPWKPQNSLLVLLLQSFDQTRKTFIRDYDEELLKEKFGINAAGMFDEDHMPWETNILKEGEYEKKTLPEKTTSFKLSPVKLWAAFPELFGKETGSNNWVVGKTKSKSGHAILANDPHLDLKTPLFWYWISLKSPGASVVGGTVPGVPVIASGTNGQVAWGLTNSYLNSADAVVVTDLKDEQIESFRPLVWIKFGFLKLPFFFKSFERLTTGQRVLPLEIEKADRLVLRWTGFKLLPKEIAPMFDLFKITNVSEMDKLLSEIGVPSWNFVFADKKGDIGYRLVGKTYRTTEKTPFGIQEMTFKDFSEEKYLTNEEKPHLLKPKRDFVSTANNRHWPSDANLYGGRGYSHSFRAFRIEQLLREKQDVESFKNIQCDRQVVDARFFLPKLAQIVKMPEFEKWHFTAEESSTVLPLYRRFLDIIFDKWTVNEYALYKMLDRLTEEQKMELNSFYSQAKVEVKGRTWGEILRVKFAHMSKNESWKYSEEVPGFGDTHTVDPGTAKWNEELKIYEQTSGASMRMIVELADEPRIWLVLPGLNRMYDKKPEFSPWLNWKNCQFSEVAL